MLYVSVRWSRLHGLNFSKSFGVIGLTEDMLSRSCKLSQVCLGKVLWQLKCVRATTHVIGLGVGIVPYRPNIKVL